MTRRPTTDALAKAIAILDELSQQLSTCMSKAVAAHDEQKASEWLVSVLMLLLRCFLAGKREFGAATCFGMLTAALQRVADSQGFQAVKSAALSKSGTSQVPKAVWDSPWA